jgi:PKHD-type hydroxylase
MFLIENFIDEASCYELQKKILAMPFVSGKQTAGPMAARVKSNLELDQQEAKEIIDDLKKRILSDDRINSLVFPKTIAHIMINRHDQEMEYGNHFDNAIIGGVRCDVSFTLFLEDREKYGGGALVVEHPYAVVPTVVKPKIGSIFLYSSGYLHRVSKVTSGSRLACVGWIQSHVRDERRREIVSDLNRIFQACYEKDGYDEVTDLIAKNRDALMRMWSD